MKKDNVRNIITDLSSDELIISRYMDEKERVSRWTKKLIFNDDNVEKCFLSDRDWRVCNRYLDGEMKNNLKYKVLGIIPWASPRTGDTWFTLVSKLGDNTKDRYGSYYYYWNTIGSIGMMHNTRLTNENGTLCKVIDVVSSHTILRYKDRMGLNDLSPFETLLHLSETFENGTFIIHHGEDRDCWQLNTTEGVFRGEIKNKDDKERPYVVIRFKTFLNKNQLSKKDYKEYMDNML